MRTLVVSDLHLGASNRADLLRVPELRAPLVAAVADGVDRFVVLGDGVELREVPVRGAVATYAPLLRELGDALGPSGEVVLLGGNHDHGLLAGWADAHLMREPLVPMALSTDIAPQAAGPLGAALAEAVAPATLRFAYPGLWLREDVYALHGHYLDLHTTVPTIERLVAGAMARFVAPVPERAVPDDYETVLAPLYAWMLALTQRSRNGVVKAGSRSSARAWVLLAGQGRRQYPVRSLAMTAGFKVAVKVLDAAGIGPLRAELSGPALRQGYLAAMGEVTRRLGISAEHIVFGHTHRSGPWPGDDQGEWRTPTGAHLMNTGSWAYQPHFVAGPAGASPYWPGTAVVVDDTGPPRLVGLLADRGHEELAAVAERED